MLPLLGRAAARAGYVDRSGPDPALQKDGSWTLTPEALALDHPEEASNAPAVSLKPGKTGAAEG